MKTILPIVLAVVLPLVSSGQCEIKGNVKDKRTGEPLPFANVFLNLTSLGAATDVNGNYRFSFPPGSYELKVSYIGYETETRLLSAEGNESVDFSVSLVASKSALSEVEVKGTRDRKWARNYRKFEKEFLGTTENARQCTVTNPWVIDFDVDSGAWQIKATAPVPVEVVNNSLGYKVHFYIKRFEIYHDKTFLLGDARFEPLVAENDEEKARFVRNRQAAYEGSERHLFKALIGGHMERDGFRLFAETRPSKVVTRSTIFKNELGKTVIPYTLVVSPMPGKNRMYIIPLDGRIEIHYEKNDTAPFYTDIPDQVSWIEGTGESVQANEMGVIQDPSKLLTLGYLRSLRVADMLPLDYRPGQ